MNYQAFTDDSLIMMYEGIPPPSGPTMSLLDSASNRGSAFGRGQHAADLEHEMLRRGMIFEVIEWGDGQIKGPFED